MSWHAFVVGLLVASAWRVYRRKVDHRLPLGLRRWIRHPWFEFALFGAALGLARMISPATPENGLWAGLALAAAFRLLGADPPPPLPDLPE